MLVVFGTEKLLAFCKVVLEFSYLSNTTKYAVANYQRDTGTVDARRQADLVARRQADLGRLQGNHVVPGSVPRVVPGQVKFRSLCSSFAENDKLTIYIKHRSYTKLVN